MEKLGQTVSSSAKNPKNQTVQTCNLTGKKSKTNIRPRPNNETPEFKGNIADRSAALSKSVRSTS